MWFLVGIGGAAASPVPRIPSGPMGGHEACCKQKNSQMDRVTVIRKQVWHSRLGRRKAGFETSTM